MNQMPFNPSDLDTAAKTHHQSTISRMLFNPFQKIAGSKALLLGLGIMIATTLIGIQSHCHFDGAIDAHIGGGGAFYFYFFETFISWLTIVLLFYLVGISASATRIRLIDLAGTSALSRFPMFFIAIIAFFFPTINPEKLTDFDDIPWGEVGQMLVLGLLIFAIVVWYVVLLYHAFKVSTNMKGSKLGIAFTIAIILAELISKGIFYLIHLVLM